MHLLEYPLLRPSPVWGVLDLQHRIPGTLLNSHSLSLSLYAMTKKGKANAGAGGGVGVRDLKYRGQYSDAVLSELENQNDTEIQGLSGKVRMLKDVHMPPFPPSSPPTRHKQSCYLPTLFLHPPSFSLSVYLDITSHIGRNNQLNHPCGENE